jgi:hypothetical protein
MFKVDVPKVKFIQKAQSQLRLSVVPGRPWAIFNVNILDMEGMGKALDWVLYHVQKRRNNIEYHQTQSASTR